MKLMESSFRNDRFDLDTGGSLIVVEDDCRSKVVSAVFLFVLTAIAVCLRFPNLGGLGLWGNEGYTAIAVKAILEHGYPVLPGGGLYLRSLPFLYLDALSARIFGLDEFALRLPSVLANLGAIWLTYLLGQRLFGRTVGLVSAVMMVFAGWEIEFSRHARMYAAFQFLYLLSLYVFYLGFIEEKRLAKWLTVPIWFLTLMVHELGIVLAVFFLIPILVQNCSRTKGWKLFFGLFGFGLSGYFYVRLQSAMRWGTVVVSEEALEDVGKDIFEMLPVEPLIRALETDPTFAYSMIIGALISIAFIIRRSCLVPARRWQYLYLIPIVFTCVSGQFGVALVCLLLYTVLFFRHPADWRQSPFLTGCGITAVSATAWLWFAWIDGLSPSRLARTFFGYPYLYERVLRFLISDWLLETALAALGAVLLWIHYIRDRDGRAIFALASLILPVLVMTMALVERGNDGSRYSFYLFPLMLLWGSYAITYVASRFVPEKYIPLTVSGVLSVLLLLPTDMRLAHSIGIPQRKYGDAIGRSYVASKEAFPVYPDLKTPSVYIRDRLEKNDVFVSLSETVPFYYVGRLDFKYVKGVKTESKSDGLGLNAIDSGEMRELLASNPGRRVWFLTDIVRIKRNNQGSENASVFLKSVARCMVYKGKDGRTAVHLFSSNREGQVVCLKDA